MKNNELKYLETGASKIFPFICFDFPGSSLGEGEGAGLDKAGAHPVAEPGSVSGRPEGHEPPVGPGSDDGSPAARQVRPRNMPQFCVLCGVCQKYCPPGAIRVAGRSTAQPGLQLALSRCRGCGICWNICPKGAMELISEPGSC